MYYEFDPFVSHNYSLSIPTIPRQSSGTRLERIFKLHLSTMYGGFGWYYKKQCQAILDDIKNPYSHDTTFISKPVDIRKPKPYKMSNNNIKNVEIIENIYPLFTLKKEPIFIDSAFHIGDELSKPIINKKY